MNTNTDNLESSEPLRRLAPASRSRFDAARTERRQQRIERETSQALALCLREEAEPLDRLKVTPCLTVLCYLMVLCLPRLTGDELEYLWTKMEELLERRREAAREGRKSA
jgi:hypothetical protein